MPGVQFWVAQAPFVEGPFGTGPVDLAVATQALTGPQGFDVPGGSGVIFDRAFWWFKDAAEKATSIDERAENFVGAVRALNNLAVWCMMNLGGEDGPQQTYNALLEAERILETELPAGFAGFDMLRGGVALNLGNLMEMIGRLDDAAQYRHRARALGVV